MYSSVSSSGDGISSLGFKSSARGKSLFICILYTSLYVLLGVILVLSIISLGFVAIVVALLMIFLIVVHVVFVCRLRETEVNLDVQTRKAIVISKHTHFGCCFNGDGERKEFPLDYVQSIDQTSSGMCSRGRQVGITIRLSTGESYSPPRSFFNPVDVARMQEFVQKFRLGVLNVVGATSPYGPGAYYPGIPLNMYNQVLPVPASYGLPPPPTHPSTVPTAYGLLPPPPPALNQPLSAPLYYYPPQAHPPIQMQAQAQQMVSMGDNYYGNASRALPTLPAPITYPGQRAPLVANGENF